MYTINAIYGYFRRFDFSINLEKNLNKGLKIKVNDIFDKDIKVNEKCPCGSGKKYKKCCKD